MSRSMQDLKASASEYHDALNALRSQHRSLADDVKASVKSALGIAQEMQVFDSVIFQQAALLVSVLRSYALL